MRRHSRGIGLIEVLIAVAVLMSITLGGLYWLDSEMKAAMRDDLAAQQAMEMGALTRALTDHLENANGLPTATDTTFEVQVADLAAAGLLPAEFAQRNGNATPRNLMGQPYHLLAVRTEDGYRGIVVADGAPDAGVLARVGMKATAESLENFNQQVMRRLRTQHLVQAGVVKAGQRQLDAAISGFSYDLGGMLAAPLTTPATVALAKFADVNVVPAQRVTIEGSLQPGAGTGGEIAPSAFDGKECRMTVDSACAAGETESWSHTMCDGWQNDTADLSTRRSAVSLGASEVVIERKGFENPVSPFMSWDAQGIFYTGIGNPMFGYGYNLGVTSITDQRTVAGGSTDHMYALGTTDIFTIGSIYQNVEISVAPGSTFTSMRELPSCGGATEVATQVYRLETGKMRYGDLSYGSYGGVDQLQPGAEFMSVVDPRVHGRPALNLRWQEKVTTPAFSKDTTCRFRYLANSVAIAPGGAGTSTDYRCSLQTKAVFVNNDGAYFKAAPPIRLFDWQQTTKPKLRYCCK